MTRIERVQNRIMRSLVAIVKAAIRVLMEWGRMRFT